MNGASGTDPSSGIANAVAVGERPVPSPLVPAEGGTAASRSARASRWDRLMSGIAEGAQDMVSGAVALTLIVLAAAILVASVVDFFNGVHRLGLTVSATDFLDRVLLVLILVEIVHTVVLSLRAHALSAQPFIVVGLVAVIRKILFTLSSSKPTSDTTLGIYIGMVAVFVAGLVVIDVVASRRRTAAGEAVPAPD